MWRDIILIIALILGILSYFHLTPRRIARYFGVVKDKISIRHPAQITYLLVAIALSIFSIFTLIYRYEDWQTEIWAYVLFYIIINDVLWLITLRNVWELSDRGNKILRIVTASIFLPSFVAYNTLVDTSLWVKISPIIGFGIGYVIPMITPYVKKKFKRSRF